MNRRSAQPVHVLVPEGLAASDQPIGSLPDRLSHRHRPRRHRARRHRALLAMCRDPQRRVRTRLTCLARALRGLVLSVLANDARRCLTGPATKPHLPRSASWDHSRSADCVRGRHLFRGVRMYQSQTRREQKERTRAAILKAARRLFSEYSYDQVSMRLIGKEAGRTAGSVTRLYESKDRLWRAAMGVAPPRDRPNVRYADQMEATLQSLVTACRGGDAACIEVNLAAAETLLGTIQGNASDR